MASATKKVIIVVVAVALFFLFTSAFASSKATLNKAEADSIKAQWGKDAQDAADFFGVPVNRILAMIGTESKGNENATGTSGERGLMQLTEGAWNSVSSGVDFSQAYTGRINIFAGTHYLKNLIDAHGDIDTATGYYNASSLANRTAYTNRVKANEQFFIN